MGTGLEMATGRKRDRIPGGITTAASMAKGSQRVLGTAGLIPQVEILGKMLALKASGLIILDVPNSHAG